VTGRPHLLETLIAGMIRDGVSHRAVAAETGVPKSTVGKIASRTNARRTDGELRGGPRVRGCVDRARRHRSTRRTTCIGCSAMLPTRKLAGGWCVPCLYAPPLTHEKVEALADELFDAEDGNDRSAALVFAAAHLLPAGDVRPDTIRAIVGNDPLINAAIDQYVEQGFFSSEGWLCLEECEDAHIEILYCLVILCGAGKVRRTP